MLKPEPVRQWTHAQTAALMWDHAQLVHEVCERVDRLFARNCLLFELGGLSDLELDAVTEKLEPLFHVGDDLEMLDLEPAERERAERYIRETLEFIRGRQMAGEDV